MISNIFNNRLIDMLAILFFSAIYLIYICIHSEIRGLSHSMNIENNNNPIVATKELSKSEVKSELSQSKIKKTLFGLAGIISLILAILGIVVPGLPCTPFALLSAALFAKSSDKLYNKLLNSRILGARIRDYKERKGVTKSGKVKVLILMWTMVLLSAFVIIKVGTLKYVILGAGVVGSIVVWFFVPEGNKDRTTQ